MARTYFLLSAPSRHDTDQSLAGSASPDASLEKASTDVEKDGDVQVLAASINESLAAAEGIDVQFMAKAGVINGALEECGMGRFQVSWSLRCRIDGAVDQHERTQADLDRARTQWELFCSAGFGYVSLPPYA